MNARLTRINSDYEQVKKDFAGHKNIIVEPIGPEPPEKYRVTYYVNGIYLCEDGKAETLDKHVVIISLPAEYPRYKPVCSISTPIWHPNFRDGQICIGDIWGAGETLSDIIVNIGDMIQYKSWNSSSPLSADAAEWAIENKHLFPIGNKNLWTSDETAEDTIEILEYTEPSPDIPEKIIEKEKPFTENRINDFVITSSELQGIEFTPVSARMQGSQNNAKRNRSKINFKTILTKGVVYGFLGGILGWLLQEFIFNIEANTILNWMGYSTDDFSWTNYMSDFEVKSIINTALKTSSGIQFAAVGLAIGSIMGIGESVYYGSKSNLAKFALTGLGVGLALGFLGGFLGQTIYGSLMENTTEYTSESYFSLIRAFGWAILGAGCGFAVGMIKPEKIRIINCVIGGMIGGFIGGFLFNSIAMTFSIGEEDTGLVPRLIGIIIMGSLVGLGIGLLEQFAKAAWLKVIRGEFEGKEYLVFSGVTSIGNNGKNTIVLFKDKLVSPNHCDIVQEGNKYILVDKGSAMGTIVNGLKIVGRHTLKQGDTISIGNSVLVFNVK